MVTVIDPESKAGKNMISFGIYTYWLSLPYGSTVVRFEEVIVSFLDGFLVDSRYFGG